eukprot:TRINITY_DN14773_c0_g1_i1.p1 TRINITY_DN14773_c0_g1~~TRINITY_DN14773_c0_g1_i1.p1  ORF type:complete len:149 (+),score=5.76 TRINITY_DN14773_c0_g1_i1:60-506(+)
MTALPRYIDLFTPYHCGPFEIHCWKAPSPASPSLSGVRAGAGRCLRDGGWCEEREFEELFVFEEEEEVKERVVGRRGEGCDTFGITIYERGLVVDPSLDGRFKCMPCWRPLLVENLDNWFGGKLTSEEVINFLDQLKKLQTSGNHNIP